jgi:V8-like Glu-specific endopeptidase
MAPPFLTSGSWAKWRHNAGFSAIMGYRDQGRDVVGVLAGRTGVRVVSTGLALAAVGATIAFAGLASATTSPGPSSATPPANVAVEHAVSSAAQSTARAFWTPSRMTAATPSAFGSGKVPASAGTSNATQAASAPPGIPSATRFNGVPTVGALFYTTGSAKHFCTASVVTSSSKNVIITAAHCVYNKSYASNVEFVPEYHSGDRPDGAWAVKKVVVATQWVQSKNPNYDFAFLTVGRASGFNKPLQKVTGGLALGIYRGYRHSSIEVIGYNDTGNRPVRCATKSFKFEPDQMEFYCHNYRNGTSGGPWILRYDNGAGTVFGVIGGFEAGGDVEWASYSPYFRESTLELLELAE